VSTRELLARMAGPRGERTRRRAARQGAEPAVGIEPTTS
jgi:hypothetical protein